jgi:hypothetical protein
MVDRLGSKEKESPPKGGSLMELDFSEPPGDDLGMR